MREHKNISRERTECKTKTKCGKKLGQAIDNYTNDKV